MASSIRIPFVVTSGPLSGISSYTGIITATGVCKVVIEDPCTPVSEGYPHIGHPARHPGISLLHHDTGPPLGKPGMEYLVTGLEVQPSRFLFHSNPLRPRQPACRLKPGPRHPEEMGYSQLYDLATTAFLHLILSKIFGREIFQEFLELLLCIFIQILRFYAEIDIR